MPSTNAHQFPFDDLGQRSPHRAFSVGQTNLLTRKQAAAYLGIKTQTLACWACNKRYVLPFVRVGRLIKYRVEDLDNFILQNHTGHGGTYAT